ncbi:MAG: energy transducer TonB [Bacteroidales bacterium]|nr:energy transducer TonB [Bacteroidales bacterium]
MTENPETRRRENRVGLYTTIIFHLVVLIILLVLQLGKEVKKEHSFILDFTQQEKQELIKQQQELKEFKERVSKELDAMIAAAPTPTVRNIAVDANDIKSRAEREALGTSLDSKLAESRRRQYAADEDEVSTGPATDSKEDGNGEGPAYSGPSVVSWNLEGRKALMPMPIPAYKGYGSGDVLVKIYVNRSGRVIKAVVASSNDSSLDRWAIRAAERTKFSRSDSADDPQIGDILYRFVAQ